jgi:hypothetical protein
MFCDSKSSYPDAKLILGLYLGPSIDTGSALTAEILKSNGVFVCRSTLRHLSDKELDSSAHKDIRRKFMSPLNITLGWRLCRRISPLKTWPQTQLILMTPMLWTLSMGTQK